MRSHKRRATRRCIFDLGHDAMLHVLEHMAWAHVGSFAAASKYAHALACDAVWCFVTRSLRSDCAHTLRRGLDLWASVASASPLMMRACPLASLLSLLRLRLSSEGSSDLLLLLLHAMRALAPLLAADDAHALLSLLRRTESFPPLSFVRLLEQGVLALHAIALPSLREADALLASLSPRPAALSHALEARALALASARLDPRVSAVALVAEVSRWSAAVFPLAAYDWCRRYVLEPFLLDVDVATDGLVDEAAARMAAHASPLVRMMGQQLADMCWMGTPRSPSHSSASTASYSPSSPFSLPASPSSPSSPSPSSSESEEEEEEEEGEEEEDFPCALLVEEARLPLAEVITRLQGDGALPAAQIEAELRRCDAAAAQHLMGEELMLLRATVDCFWRSEPTLRWLERRQRQLRKLQL
ncbi:hypothetical protein AB1Y20_017218 [Prymnesium parvum]|uniref:Uncharacterized protein n=1 Tax=Prymnesium parvum TaxID=97485 RepID=A0AB34I7C9_PRYPA